MHFEETIVKSPVQDSQLVWKRLIDALSLSPEALKEIAHAPRKSS
jgi:hypothetical protein